MARIRNIKPEFFTSESVSVLPLRARLTWIGLWTHCDNHGRTRDNVKLIKAAVWPLDDVSLKDIEDDLATLTDHGRIVRYGVAGKRYLVITNWGEHQYGAFKGDPKYPQPVDNPSEEHENAPPPAEQEKSRDDLNGTRTSPHKSTGIQGSSVKGQGGGTRGSANPPPTPRCRRHTGLPADDPGPACRICRDLRLATEQATHTPKADLPPWCGKCDHTTRLRENADRDPFRCPTCHPHGRRPTGRPGGSRDSGSSP